VKVTIGKRGDYAVRAVLDLSLHYRRERRKARQIARAMGIPRQYLSRILAELVRDGILVAVAGQGGGYELGRPPSKISLLEVIEATEGPLELRTCILRNSACRTADKCSVHDIWSKAQEAMRTRLGAATFSQIARVQALLEGSC